MLKLTINGVEIYKFSFRYSETKSDAAIVLGAGTTKGKVSPIFKERLNHSMYLLRKKSVNYIILTGGIDKNQKRSDSEIARDYLINNGILDKDILIEKHSKYTIENLIETKAIMDSLNLTSALVISDPLHMKRSIELAKNLKIKCQPSPTPSTMYRSFVPKAKSLIYETIFFSLGEATGHN
ncbi:YdcF family protein [Aureibacter tunicatorum]|uniref:Uncharacterized SAM-binding protein YcdF (DUF218 family) n=1 Tax=Aureibacter tunicatorum TaxID=866807 RepID=A0AAE4BSM9_9BACT|nr:YdcF family protein [Aureibacter tunicatorum]MDR6241389.1 uncharacterized SAM-binding protein YcdF (DUF218 family) [Aureibacter tunicatorum]BDD06766.1 multidrug MFS transporter [Aureibacter tunicatorum]